MEIPNSFQLGAHTIKVMKNAKLAEGAYGEWHESTKIIKLRPVRKTWSPNFAAQVFLHEAIHSILDFIGRVELGRDESFVDSFAEAALQVILSIEGERDGKGKE